MTLKDKVKTYSFWISLVSAILIVVRVIGQHFGWFINESLIMDIVTGVCGVLVLLGILSSPTKKETIMEDIKTEINNATTNQTGLNNQIKEDVKTSQLTIKEQIELLKKQAQQEDDTQSTTEFTVNNTNQKLDINEVEDLQSAQLIQEETVSELESEALQEELQDEQTISETLTVAEQPTAVELVDAEELTKEQTLIIIEEPNLKELQHQQETETLQTQQETVSQNQTINDIDFSGLSNAQLKVLLNKIIEQL